MIWGAMVIPVLVSIYLLTFHRKDTKAWELIVIFGICIPVIFGAKALSEKALTNDIEYWGSMSQRVSYDEPWDEYIHQTCQSCSTDSNGNTSCTSYDCSYVSYHGERSWITTDINGKIPIPIPEYRKVVKRWGGKETFVDMKRDYHNKDGDRYYVNWPGEYSTAIPITTKETWENRVQAASDVFNFQEVLPEDIEHHGLYPYPKIPGFVSDPVLGYNDPAVSKRYAFMNGFYGPKKRIRLWVLIFTGKSDTAGKYQEALWKGGNKNEFVICVGIDKEQNVQWTNVFSWSDNSSLKIGTRNFINSQKKLDLLATADYLEKNVMPTFVKKDFREFSYLEVNPSTKAIIISYLIVLLINIGVAVWVVKNGIGDESPRSRYGRFR